MFTPAEVDACRGLAVLALQEDLGPACVDLTSQAVIPADLTGRAAFVARTSGVLAGVPALAIVAAAVDVTLDPLVEDGADLRAGTRIAVITGKFRSLLAAERTALNFVQHLSGVATLTRRYVDAVAGLPAQILDTRKTLPGWRLLQKYAVRCGGGRNHRLGLFDGILIKDNHLARLADRGVPAVAESVRAARARADLPSAAVELEVDTLDQLDEALAARPDIILLDNMAPDALREAVRRRDAVAPGVRLEASGGVTLQTVRAIAESGVDRVSVGALTHSAPALDIGLDYEP